MSKRIPIESDLPEGWAFASLGDGLVQDVRAGFACGEHNREGDGIAHIRPMNVTPEGETDFSDIKFVPVDRADRDERWLQKGDVVFNNTNSPELVGKTTLYRDEQARAFSNHMTRIRCRTDALDPAFCARVLHHLWQTGYFAAVCTHHVSQASVGRSALLATEIPLPPVAEQRRIATRVNSLLARVQETLNSLSNVAALLTRFRQAILAATCSGELTGTWRQQQENVEPASSLLTRMLAERKAKWELQNPQHRYGQPEQMTLGDLPDIPETWIWTNFDHCAWDITVGHVGPMKTRYVDSGIPFLRSQNVRPLRFDSNGLVFIGPEFHATLKKSVLRGGEILVTRSGANTGDCCVYPEGAGEGNCADLVITRPLSGLLPSYAAIYISSPDGQRQIGLHETGLAQPHFNIAAMRLKPFPLPPVAEQREIVRRVEALFHLADGIERCVTAARLRADGLRQAILTRAFHGELVPTEADLARAEGREYETADQLLARIPGAAKESPAPIRKKGKPAMRRKLDRQTVEEAIRAMPKDRFGFGELLAEVSAEYEPLKEILFSLLDDSSSGLVQVFDEEAQTMQFLRRTR